MGPLVLFAVGAVLGTALDHLHVAAGVLAYPQPFLFSQAAWVPPLFGVAVVAFVQLHRPFRDARDGAPSLLRLAGALALFAAAYATTALGFHSPRAVVAILLPSWALLAAGPGFTRRAAYGIVIAALGTAFESALIGAGGFHYLAGPRVMRVPVWLPALYLHASLLTAQLALAASSAPGAWASGRAGRTLTSIRRRFAA